MTKSFESYMDFYQDLVGLDLNSHPALLFFYNATNNALGCNCGGRIASAKTRYRSLITTLTDSDKQFLKNRYNCNTLSLKQDQEIFNIDL